MNRRKSSDYTSYAFLLTALFLLTTVIILVLQLNYEYERTVHAEKEIKWRDKDKPNMTTYYKDRICYEWQTKWVKLDTLCV